MAGSTRSILPLTLAIAGGFAVGAFTAATLWNSSAPWRLRRRRRAYNSGAARRDGRRGRVCVICSGSVAAVKAAELCEALLSLPEVECVDLVLTRAGAFFQGTVYRGSTGWQRLNTLCAKRDSADSRRRLLEVWTDDDEWCEYNAVGDPVLHIDLAKRADLLLWAPLCAHSLHGLSTASCAGLGASIARAWLGGLSLDPNWANPIAERHGWQAVNKPLLVAPAMNTAMWHQRATQDHQDALLARGIHVVPPITKRLACGDTGQGALAEVKDIAVATREHLVQHIEAVAMAREQGLPEFEL